MKCKVHIVDPAGNITAFVDGNIEKERYSEIAKRIIEETGSQVEQVAYINKPINGGEVRIDMMGHEFCGNATRAFGYLYLALNNETSRSIMVEISGIENPLEVVVDMEASKARTDMPFPLSLEYLFVSELESEIPIIVMDGIMHAIIENYTENKEISNLILESAKKKFNFDAFGLMYVDGNKMTPLVYVVDTDTLIYEGSCGSGTMSYAIFLAKDLKDGKYDYCIEQPGGIIDGFITKENNEYLACIMGGKINIIESIEMDL
ncbi:MAG: hypothetical protein RR425_04940 [Erysipelotrichales bacterium]